MDEKKTAGKTTNMEVKKNNRNRIFRYIRNHDITSNPDIAYDLKISLPTVTQNTKELMARGLVKETGKLKSTGGKRAVGLSVSADFKMAAGVDITENHVSFILADLKGQVRGYERIARPFEHSSSYYSEVSELLGQFLEKNKGDSRQILGIGISIPGIVNLDQREISNSRVLKVEAVKFDMISRFFPYPCRFLNDANAGAYAEGIHGDAGERFFYLSLSSTVGGAIFDRGELVQGRHFQCGEVGHMSLVIDGKPCYCGKKGCMDAYCSAKCLTKRTGKDLESFFAELGSENPEAVNAWEEYTSYLAVALDNISMVLDCDIVIGGYVGGYIETHMEKLQKKVAERNIFGKQETGIRPCAYRFEAAALGAALSVIEKFIEEI